MTNMERDESVMKFIANCVVWGLMKPFVNAELKTETLSESETSKIRICGLTCHLSLIA